MSRFRPCTDEVTAGDRVATHPATDAWMMGDRAGVVVAVGARFVHVRCDRSNRVRRFRPCDVSYPVRDANGVTFPPEVR